MRSVLIEDEDEREQAFREHKQSGEQMVHRLRDWQEGDILWGYESVSPNGSTGKTFSRRNREKRKDRIGDLSDLDPQDAHESARDAFDQMADPDPDAVSLGGGPDSSIFLYAARIESVRTEGPGPDPGEPPLKFAQLGKVAVVDSKYIPPEDDE